MNGPETKELLTLTKGYVITTGEHARGIVAKELPSGKELTIKAPNMNDNPIHMIGGPDKKGRIAVIESIGGSGGAETEQYSLKVIDMDSRAEKTVFLRKGTYWSHIAENYGNSFSLSDSEGVVSFISRLKSTPVHNNTRYFEIGNLEIIYIESGEAVKSDIKAIDEGLSWSPNGNFIAYSELLSRQDLTSEMQIAFADGFGKQWQEWESAPIVSIFDVRGHASRRLHAGLNPVVSKDGLSILVRDDEGHFKLLYISNTQSVTVAVPGGDASFSMIGNGLALYRGLPTTGSKQHFRLTSTLGVLPYWTLKIADVNTGKFLTIMPKLDPWRGKISYGPGRTNR